MFKANLFAANHFAPNHFSHGAVIIIIQAAQKTVGFIVNVGRMMGR